MATLNDVIDYARFYGGSDEPPVFCHEHFDLDNKIFVATDDFKLAQKLTSHTVEDTAAFESGISAAIDMIQPDYICKNVMQTVVCICHRLYILQGGSRMKPRTCRLSAGPDAERRKTKRPAMYCSTPQTSQDDVHPKTVSKRIPHLPPVWQGGRTRSAAKKNLAHHAQKR